MRCGVYYIINCLERSINGTVAKTYTLNFFIAFFKAIDNIINPALHTFDLYTINSISEGKDTLGDVTVKLKADGKSFVGRGLSTDTIEASIRAYLKAINKLQAYANVQKGE